MTRYLPHSLLWSIAVLVLACLWCSPTVHATSYTTVYGSVSNVTVTTDANSNTTTRTFNYKGLPRQITDALEKVTGLEYVSAENLAALTDANGNQTGFSYNSRGLLAKETPPVGVPIRYEYNAAGLVTKKINDTTNEVLIGYSYDPQGRMSGRSYLDGSADSFTYDGAGRLTTASNQNISYIFDYDTYGRLQSQTDSNGNVVAYGYDDAGRRTSLTINNAHAVTYGYTADKLTSITSSLAGAFGYSYDSLGRRSSITYPNGITGTYSHNDDQPGWLAGISYNGNQNIYNVTYPTFDKVGNRTAKNEGSLITYGYDAVYRLLNSTAGEVFTYDAAGNRLTDAARLYTVTAGNVMAAAGSTSFTYDAYGNTLTAGTWTYGWNSAGQLVGAANGSTVASNAYDPFGRRIGKTVNGVSTSYIYDGQDISATVSNGNVTHLVHGSGVDEHLALVQSGTPYFVHVDGLGSVTRITDTSQNVVASISYDSFGNGTRTGIIQPYGFTGREYDPDTGLNYHRARYLSMDTGRWLSLDPLRLAAGDVVLSNYVGGNGINWVDPEGEEKRGTSSKLRNKWEAHTGQPWPVDSHTGRKYDVSHIVPLADGGTNHVSNIEPMLHQDHIKMHKENGDFKRWAKMKSCKITKASNVLWVISSLFSIAEAKKLAEQYNTDIWTIMSRDLLGLPVDYKSDDTL